MKRNIRKKRAWLGRLIVAEMIVCYLAVLTLVSYACGPEKYRAATENPLLAIADFTSFAGEPAGEDGLVLANDTAGQAVGYFAELPLEGLESIQIVCRVDCPPEYAGGTLVVDLYNLEAGYDNAEQEYRLILEPGVNEACFSLTPGESAPDTAQLRFFTLDPAAYVMQNLMICPLEALPKVAGALLAAGAACFLLLAVTAAVYYMAGRLEKAEKDGDKKDWGEIP